MTKKGDVGEELFERYLNDHAIPFERDREWGGLKPDFTLETDSGEIVCEVITLDAALPAGGGAYGGYGPIRDAINEKIRQGKGPKAKGVPYVIVVHAPNWPLDDMTMIGAAFGNVGITFPVDTTTGAGDMEAAESAFLGGGRLQKTLNTRVSAIVFLHNFSPALMRLERALDGVPGGDTIEEQFQRARKAADELAARGEIDDDERLPRIDVVLNPYAAVSLPIEVFSEPMIRVYGEFENALQLVAEGIELEYLD